MAMTEIISVFCDVCAADCVGAKLKNNHFVSALNLDAIAAAEEKIASATYSPSGALLLGDNVESGVTAQQSSDSTADGEREARPTARWTATRRL